MTFKQLENKIVKSVDEIVARNAKSFHADIVFAWPVGTPESTGIPDYKGGTSKAAWAIAKTDNTTWTVMNHINYSPILFHGRIGKRGSYQLKDGGYPILKAAEIRMMADFKRHTL